MTDIRNTTVDEVLQLAGSAENDLPDIPYWVTLGHPESRVIIHVPHAARRIPQHVRDEIVLDDEELTAELDAMTDSFTDVIAQRVADTAAMRPWIFVNKFSRLVVDPERFPDASEEMNAVGMGVVYTRTSSGAALREEDDYDHQTLIDMFFDRYARAFTDLVDERLDAVDQVTIVDLHSYPLEPLPYELHGDGPRPEICLGTDAFHTPTELVASARAAFGSFEVGLDSPFAGTYVPLDHHGKDTRVESLMVEIRRDLYMDDDFTLVEPALEPIVEAVVRLIGQIDPEPLNDCSGFFIPPPADQAGHLEGHQ